MSWGKVGTITKNNLFVGKVGTERKTIRIIGEVGSVIINNPFVGEVETEKKNNPNCR